MFVVGRGQLRHDVLFICQRINQIRVSYRTHYRLIPTQILLVDLVKMALDLVQEDTSSTPGMIILSSASLIGASFVFILFLLD